MVVGFRTVATPASPAPTTATVPGRGGGGPGPAPAARPSGGMAEEAEEEEAPRQGGQACPKLQARAAPPPACRPMHPGRRGHAAAVPCRPFV